MSYEHINNSSMSIPTWAPTMMGALGALEDEDVVLIESVDPVETSVTPVCPTTPVFFEEPGIAPSQDVIAGYSDYDLTQMLNAAIAEGWRIKGCHDPYCMVQAHRNRMIRLSLLNEYRRRQIERPMPPLVEPQHTLAYSRYKLSKTVLNWADTTLTARLLWPVKIYLKAGATALEDIVGSQYLNVLIITSPLIGVYAIRHLGYRGLLSTLFGGYLGMTVAAMLPMTLFGLAQTLGASEEKDFLWAIS